MSKMYIEGRYKETDYLKVKKYIDDKIKLIILPDSYDFVTKEFLKSLLKHNITAEETDDVIESIEENVVVTALRKTPQELTENEKEIARTNIQAQKELTLTVKDNGNIVIGNLNGESKEFMPATPSGDPLHYAYLAAGAEYNDSGADKTKTTPWGETVTHKAGHYYLNGLGDITEEQMMEIYNTPHNAFYQYGYINSKARTVFQKGNGAVLTFNGNLTAWVYSSMFESFGNGDLYTLSADLTKSFKSCKKLKYITFSNLYCQQSVLTETFDGCVELKYVNLNRLSSNVSFKDSVNIEKDCILFIISKSLPSKAITIALHPDAYARIANQPDIIAALEAKPLVTLVSA